jgi:putative OPT family oligopeptide transporter
VAITFLFTAANVYLGLKVGLTFATSIPAAVISMALLRAFKDAGILENNIVQTVASAAGTLAAIIFVLPGLVMVGWWHGFPYWQTFTICATGGVLGVMFSIPLRRALVTHSALPYPEGVAAAEVLKVGAGAREGTRGGRNGFAAIVSGSVVSFGYAALAGTQLVASNATRWVRVGGAVTGIDAGLSFALLGVGHLVGLSVGMAMLLGVVLAFGVALPVMSWWQALSGDPTAIFEAVWGKQIRFIGAGVIGSAALWTLASLVRPIWRGLREAAAASRLRASGTAVSVEERDLPIGAVALVTAALIVPIAWLLHDFLVGSVLAPLGPTLIAGSIIFILVTGAFVAAVCGYMAGLIGASNSPLSGVGILAVIGAAVLLAVLVAPHVPGSARDTMVAYALFVTAVVFAAATISNDNLQDLKTGQLVGATPWAQQIALIVGVLAGAAVIPPILNLLDHAYGFASIVPGVASPSAPLPAPQATLISALARGVLGGSLDWSLIGAGVGMGLALIGLDAWLGARGRLRLPPLAVGIGIYLPMSSTLFVVAGAVVGHLYERRHTDAGTRQLGVLLASGLIVGESLFGVMLAGLIVATGNGAPLALVGAGFAGWAQLIGLAVFAALAVAAYRWIERRGAPNEELVK